MRVSSTQMFQSGLRNIIQKQSELSELQTKIATQRRFLSSAEDPIAAAASLRLESDIAAIDQYKRNAEMAEANNTLEESALNGITTILFRMKELMVSLGDGAYEIEELNSIKTEISERLEESLGLANSRNSFGDYLFSGFKNKTLPFTIDAAGNVTYNGDQGQRNLKVSGGVSVPISDSGFDIFIDSYTGNGKVLTDANAANTGTGVIVPKDLSSLPFITSSYEIQFTSDTTFDVVDLGPPVATLSSNTYTEGQDITFAGVTVAIEGAPLNGDVFSIVPATRQSFFTTMQQVVSAIDAYSASDSGIALFRNKMIGLDGAFDNARESVDLTRAKIGSRLNSITQEMSTNEDVNLLHKQTLSKLKDLDIVEAASQLSQQTTVLEASQSSFVRVQRLSLFNFL